MRMPAEAFDPREFLREEMGERGMVLANLPTEVRRWLETDRPMSQMVAHGISAVLTTSPAFWMRLDDAWQSRGEP